jgi:hypothetical protein
MTNDSQKLTDSEKHAFLFGYLRGHMKGIQGIFEKTHELIGKWHCGRQYQLPITQGVSK